MPFYATNNFDKGDFPAKGDQPSGQPIPELTTGDSDPSQPYEFPADQEFVAPQKKQMNPWLAGAIGGAIGIVATSLVLVGGIPGFDSATTEAMNLMEDAVTLCGEPSGIYISDEGRSLLFDTKGEEESRGASVSDLGCILNALDIPEHALDKMGRTTALAGNQSATWGNFEAEWSYHPDRGMDGVVIVIAPE